MDDKDKIIAELKQEIIQLREEIRLLKEDITRLKKDSGNSSKPPSSDIVKPKKTTRKVSRKKRKRGGQFGHRKFSRPAFAPEQVDEIIEYELKDRDAVGLNPLDEWFVIQQIELPEKMYKVIEHRARKYLDPATGQIHIAPMPDEIRFLAEHSVEKLSRWGHQLLKWLKKLFKTLHSRSRYTSEGFIRAMEQIKQGFLRRMRR